MISDVDIETVGKEIVEYYECAWCKKEIKNEKLVPIVYFDRDFHQECWEARKKWIANKKKVQQMNNNSSNEFSKQLKGGAL